LLNYFFVPEKLVKFVWTEECDEAFKELKKHLISLILSFPTDQGRFILETDASNRIDAVLSQKQEARRKL